MLRNTLIPVFAFGLLSCVHTPETEAVRPPSMAIAPLKQDIALGALDAWRPGYLDIHHINTGRGNAAFFIFPDGTTMLFDAGALENDWDRNHKPLQQSPAFPDDSRRPGEWIADYITQFAPPGMRQIDYALISHFHSDHYGRVLPSSPSSSSGDWKLAGITDVAERWQIATLIDRGYPDYSFPRNVRDGNDASLANYFRFVDANVQGGCMMAESLGVGRDDQIRLKIAPAKYPSFSVDNIAANGRVSTEEGVVSFLSTSEIMDDTGGFNENPLSLVIKVNYGAFDYVTGGDLTGVNEPDQQAWFNIESKVAPVVGEADAMTLNHHGNRDATNADWLRTIRPRVMVEQTWVSDHPGGEVVARITSRTIWPEARDIFATYIHDATKIAIGPWLTENYKSTEGHIVIRVQPGGDSYDIYILEDRDARRYVTGHFGPYQSRAD